MFTLEEQFFGYFDLCFRACHPQTEKIGRESYRGEHPSEDRRFLFHLNYLILYYYYYSYDS